MSVALCNDMTFWDFVFEARSFLFDASLYSSISLRERVCDRQELGVLDFMELYS